VVTENQTEKDIAHLAEQAAGELLEAMPTLKAAQPIERVLAIMQAEQGGAARLKAVLSDDPSFGDLRAGWIQQRGGFGMAMQDYVLSLVLINGVIDGHSAKSLIAEARAFAASRTSITEWYTPLAGVTVTEAVSLGRDIDLIPWADVPDGDQKTKFGPDSLRPKLALSIQIFPQMLAVATSAIRIRSAECQVLFSSYKDAKIAIEDIASENAARNVQVQDIVRCITALSVLPVAAIGNWGQFNQKIANNIGGAGYSYGQALFESALHAASSKPVALDGASVALLFHRFEDFNASEKSVMRVALDRLNQALRRQNIVDKAIDLGIALEVMLLHGIGENDRGELRFRSSIRGATFLGGGKPERLKTLKLLKDAYDLRSKAVHSGVLKKEKKGLPPERVLEDATSTCARIARKLINRGSFPDWDAEYVIGAEQ
jgi:hypothetical protein